MLKDFLRGKRIAITAFDLENQEHRGIASFIKSTIKILSKYGAEVYLITSFDCHIKLKHKNDQALENIFVNKIYDFLSVGRGYRQLFYSNTKYTFKLHSTLIAVCTECQRLKSQHYYQKGDSEKRKLRQKRYRNS